MKIFVDEHIPLMTVHVLRSNRLARSARRDEGCGAKYMALPAKALTPGRTAILGDQADAHPLYNRTHSR
jgi:hypothetical protein